jgi:hypothetical protein
MLKCSFANFARPSAARIWGSTKYGKTPSSVSSALRAKDSTGTRARASHSGLSTDNLVPRR